MPDDHNQGVRTILLKAGWYPGRRCADASTRPAEFAIFDQAQAVLDEFGGLHIGDCGPGIDLATSDIEFNPNLCTHLVTELKEYEIEFHTRLYPLGEVQRGHGYLVLDAEGRTYLLFDELNLLAPSFVIGLDMLLLGKKTTG